MLNYFSLIDDLIFSFRCICSFRREMLSELLDLLKFDLLTFSVAYDVRIMLHLENIYLRKKRFFICQIIFYKTFCIYTFSKPIFFIISCWYSLSSLLSVPSICSFSLFNWDLFGSDKQVLFPATFNFTDWSSFNRCRRIVQVLLVQIISFSNELLTSWKT